MTSTHICDEYCLCPEHNTALFYNERLESHACPDMQCQYAHGIEAGLLNKYVPVRWNPQEYLGLWFENDWRTEEPDGVARGQSGPQGCHP